MEKIPATNYKILTVSLYHPPPQKKQFGDL